MFSYIDPSVKAELAATGKLFCLDELGEKLPKGAADPFLHVIGPIPLPITVGAKTVRMSWYVNVRHTELTRIEQVVDEVQVNGPRMLYALISEHMAVNSALVYGDFAGAKDPLVRVHSSCLTGDVLGSMRCDCGPQLWSALRTIVDEGAGALIYMAGHEGRGIGLWAKAVTYILQDAGHDTYQANEHLGLPTDSRDFTDAGRILNYLRAGKKTLRLLGNNPAKREALERFGFDVTSQQPLVAGINPFNIRYLRSKLEHGHAFLQEALSDVEAKDASTPEK